MISRLGLNSSSQVLSHSTIDFVRTLLNSCFIFSGVLGLAWAFISQISSFFVLELFVVLVSG